MKLAGIMAASFGITLKRFVVVAILSMPLNHHAFAQSCNVGTTSESATSYASKSSAELTTIINQNVQRQGPNGIGPIGVSGCIISWENNHAYASVDARAITGSSCEIFQGAMIFHPLAKAEAVLFRPKSGSAPLRIDFGSFHIPNHDPNRYWRVKLAFDALAKQIASSCR